MATHLHLPHPHLPHLLRDHEGDGHPGHLTAAALAVAAAVTVGVGAHLVLDGDDTAARTGASPATGEAAVEIVQPTTGVRAADGAVAPVVAIAVAAPAGTAVTSVALLAADGSEVAVSVPVEGTVRFEGLAPGSYTVLSQAETPVEAEGAVAISAATVLVHGPVVLDAPGTLAVDVG